MFKSFFVATILFATTAASASQITYTSADTDHTEVSITFHDGISPDVNEQANAGPFVLHTDVGLITAYCVDLFDNLKSSGTYTTQQLTSDIAKHGNMFANLIPLGVGSDNAGAAAQVAIWKVEYGDAFSYVANDAVTALVKNDLALVGYDGSKVGNGYRSARQVTELFAAKSGSGVNQNLITASVAEPIMFLPFVLMVFGIITYRLTARGSNLI